MKFIVLLNITLLTIVVLLTGCGTAVQSESQSINEPASVDETSDCIDLSTSINYLFYDTDINQKSISVPIDEELASNNIVKLECYQDEQWVTDNVLIVQDELSNNVLAFQLLQYVDSFNTVVIETDLGDDITLYVGQFYFEKIDENTLPKDKALPLKKYWTKDSINKFEGNFEFSGNIDDYMLVLKVPEKLEVLDILKNDFVQNDNEITYKCNIVAADFVNYDLNYINFDTIIKQVDKKNNIYNLLTINIPLEKK